MPLPRSTLVFYALPSAGVTAMHWFVMIYLLKYSTDVLGLEPALFGGVFALGRIWDALSDPLAGWLSDRTRTLLGRRRPWMFAAALPLAFSFHGLWSQPGGTGSELAAIRLGFFLLVYYTATTAFGIPHRSLGAELSPDHHERTRVSAHRVAGELFGMVLAIACLHQLESAADLPGTASRVAGTLAGGTALAIAAATAFLREPREDVPRRLENPLHAFADVVANPHALRLGFALLFGELAFGSIMVAIPYTRNLGGASVGIAERMFGFLVVFALALPIWVALGRRFGKVRCWLAATAGCAATFVAMGFAVDRLPIALPLLTALVGLSNAGMRIFSVSLQADVIDWDEAMTGERKEGTYFAAWNWIDKLAGAASVAVVGIAIQGADGGIDPRGVVLVVSYLPAALLAASAWILAGFRLDAVEHARLRAQIEARAAKRVRKLAAAAVAGVPTPQ